MSIESDIKELSQKKTAKFKELKKTCDKYFGVPRVKGSHHIYKTPWPGDPRINIQNIGGEAKSYQIKQVIKALEKLNEVPKDEKK